MLAVASVTITASAMAQGVTWVKTTQDKTWVVGKTSLGSKSSQFPVLTVSGTEEGVEFKAWGTCFNELDWDAINMLTRSEQEEIMSNIFSPNGDLKFTRGRLTMNANDYSRSWYSCDEMAGDFQLKYFNIDRDKQSVIPLVRAAQRYNPDLTFWASPWCPPSWMKINGDYPVVSSKYNTLSEKQNYLLYGNSDAEVDENEMKLTGARDGVFPRQLATNDFMIQDPRYLTTYADFFCKFIDAYKEQGIPITMVMYQNEAYSYTPYPGCAWTAEGTIRFNRDYLAPILKKKHPEVKLYLGTINTNRQDYIEKIFSDEKLVDCIDGVGFQWEAREILPAIRSKYPQLNYIQSESECGRGTFDWSAGEHTFFLLSDYIGKGCNEYYIWNFILPDNGESPWGWRQNALIHVDSNTRKFTYTPEYYAVKHFSHYVAPGFKMVAHKSDRKTPVIVFQNEKGKYVVMAGNFNDSATDLCVKLGSKFLSVSLDAHSFNSFIVK